MSIFENQNFIFLLALAIFFGIVFYFGVHNLVLRALDQRAQRIRDELDEARRLREEAQKTFAEFERKQREVEEQAKEIVEQARREAERNAEQAKNDLEVQIERRIKGAEDQIQQAEREAVNEVRNRAVRVAVAAAAEVMKEKMSDDKANSLTDSSIETVGRRLN